MGSWGAILRPIHVPPKRRPGCPWFPSEGSGGPYWSAQDESPWSLEGKLTAPGGEEGPWVPVPRP